MRQDFLFEDFQRRAWRGWGNKFLFGVLEFKFFIANKGDGCFNALPKVSCVVETDKDSDN